MTRIALANGVSLDVWDSGQRDAPALIFLHGFPENQRTWRHQIAALSARYRCVAPDQRGYGESDRPADVRDYAFPVLMNDIFLLADALGIDRFTVIGHDWGGAVAWGVAAMGQANGRVERAIIANAPHPVRLQHLLWTDPAQREASQYMREFRDPANDAMVAAHGLGAILKKAIKWGRPDALEPEERDLQFAQWRDPVRAFAMLNWYRASPLDVPAPDAPYDIPADAPPPALPPLNLPVLVIWGMDDQALLPKNVDDLDVIVPNMVLHPLPGHGHFVPWEAPQAVTQAISAFLAST